MGRSKEWEDNDILQLFIDADKPVLGTGTVAEATGYEPQHASRRLNKLEKKGYVRSDKVGQVLVWWITLDGRNYVDTQE